MSKTETQHTPGPWKVSENTRERTIQVDTANGTVVQPGAISWKPDAYVIAAAPLLLEALERMERAFNVAEVDPLIAFATLEQARHAIRAARRGDHD